MNQWLTDLTKKLTEVQWYTWVVVILLVILFFVLIRSGKSQKWNSQRIAYASMCVAIAFVLSCIRLYRMPQGGSITPLSLMPLIAFALACGPMQGALVGCAYGFLSLLFDMYVIHPMQMLVDYPLASAALALGGFAAFLPIDKRFKLPAAVILAYLGRLIMATLSGVVFFSEYAPEGQPVVVYSTLYNLSYLGPDALLCFACAFIPGISRVVDIIRGDQAR